MPTYVSAPKKSSYRSGPQAPVGVHPGVCVDVIDVGMEDVAFNGIPTGKKQRKGFLVWELAKKTPEGKRYVIDKKYTFSLHEKAGLRKDLENWRGRAFTDEELRKFDVDKVIGVSGLLNCTRKEGREWTNVTAIMPLPEGIAKVAPGGEYVRVKDEPESQDREDPDELPAASDEDVPF